MAVVRVGIDQEGRLRPSDYEAGLRQLRSLGVDVIASPAEQLPDRRREIELVVDDGGAELSTARYVDWCADAFGLEATLGVITYVSRGTDEDALGVLRRFGVAGEVVRTAVSGEELVTVTIAEDDLGRVPESRLHTALEAALNCDVQVAVR